MLTRLEQKRLFSQRGNGSARGGYAQQSHVASEARAHRQQTVHRDCTFRRRDVKAAFASRKHVHIEKFRQVRGKRYVQVQKPLLPGHQCKARGQRLGHRIGAENLVSAHFDLVFRVAHAGAYGKHVLSVHRDARAGAGQHLVRESAYGFRKRPEVHTRRLVSRRLSPVPSTVYSPYPARRISFSASPKAPSSKRLLWQSEETVTLPPRERQYLSRSSVG